MPYATIEKDYDCLTDSQQRMVGLFVRFLLSQGREGFDMTFDDIQEKSFPIVVPCPKQAKQTERKLGGFEKGFYMSPDFDKSLDVFAEYM